MLYTDYGLPQILDRKKVCFKPPKYAKVKLLIKFIKNSTLMKWFTFWQFKTNFTVGKKVLSPLYLIPHFLTSFLSGNSAHSPGKLFFYCNF